MVSSRRGTTRDYLAATISLDGIPCGLIDTAGIDDAGTALADGDFHDAQLLTSSVNRAAQSLSIERREQATIRACCIDAQSVSDESLLLEMRNEFGASGCDIVVLTKADTILKEDLPPLYLAGPPTLLTSSRTGQGLDDLCAALGQLIARDKAALRGQVVAATANRCRESVRLAETFLRKADELVVTGGGNELVAVELRASLEELGRVVGAVYTDDLLDRIFGTFCIGK